MDNAQARNRTFERNAWGAFCVWWEMADLFQFLLSDTWILGCGLILIVLNVARVRNGLPISGFTSTAGILAFAWGGLDIAGSSLELPFELPVIPILLIILGVIVCLPHLVGKVASKQEARNG
jgi:hypothetical protein